MLSNNLLKAGRVVVHEEEKRVIDNNALLQEKLSAALHAASASVKEETLPEEDEFSQGLEAENVDALFDPEKQILKDNSAAERERDAILQEIKEAKAQLSELKEQADGMIEEAKSQIGAMQMKAYEEAKNQGYQEGERLGRQEADKVKNDYLAQKKKLEEDYEKKIAELEPEFIDTLTGIYEHIFKVDLFRYRDLVTSLLINAIQKTAGNRNFFIHVSRDDYESVLANVDRIRSEAGGSSVSMEIVEDMTLSRSQCFIETENGIYDCSLDTQLSELRRKLKLISYERS